MAKVSGKPSTPAVRDLSQFSWPDMQSALRDLTQFTPEIILPDYRINIIQVRPYIMPKGWSVRPHEHSFYELNLILKGNARDDAMPNQKLTPGHVYFHGPQTLHSWGAPDCDCMRLIIWFMIDPPLQLKIPKRWPEWPWLLHDFAHLMRSAITRSPGWASQVAAHLSVILSQTLTQADIPNTQQPSEITVDPMVVAVNSYIEDNYMRLISLDDVASCAGVSISGLVHRYRRLTGMTVQQRLLSIRMEQAAYLLNESDLPLKSICTKVGIQQSAYFCRLFKRYFHATPGEFRMRGKALTQ